MVPASAAIASIGVRSDQLDGGAGAGERFGYVGYVEGNQIHGDSPDERHVLRTDVT
jgi:hypothetical protein